MPKEEANKTAWQVLSALATEWLFSLARQLDGPIDRAAEIRRKQAAEEEDMIQLCGALGQIPTTHLPEK